MDECPLCGGSLIEITTKGGDRRYLCNLGCGLEWPEPVDHEIPAE